MFVIFAGVAFAAQPITLDEVKDLTFVYYGNSSEPANKDFCKIIRTEKGNPVLIRKYAFDGIPGGKPVHRPIVSARYEPQIPALNIVTETRGPKKVGAHYTVKRATPEVKAALSKKYGINGDDYDYVLFIIQPTEDIPFLAKK